MATFARAQTIDAVSESEPGHAVWLVEKITLLDGQVLEGFIEQQSETQVTFIEIRRPLGRPLYLLVRELPVQEIHQIDRLEPTQRQILQERIIRLKNRSRFERGELESIELEAKGQGQETTLYLYDESDWFQLQSTANEEMTKRCVLRIQQIFAVYRRVLPPMSDTVERKPTFLLFGTVNEYRRYLSDRGLKLQNPSFFSAQENMVVAASELTYFSTQLEQVHLHHEQIRKDHIAVKNQFTAELARLNSALREQNVSGEERRRITLAYQKTHDLQMAAAERRIKLAERRNLANFDALVQRMFSRIYHEAFHAYLENFLFPETYKEVPRWLNEGLAQVFEGGLLDGDFLRIDSPDRERLFALQADLQSAERLPLVSLLQADADAFLVLHDDQAANAAKHYLYAWGVGYYLLFGDDAKFNSQSFTRYVQDLSLSTDTVKCFEQFVEEDLEVFESKWRQFILSLTVDGSPPAM